MGKLIRPSRRAVLAGAASLGIAKAAPFIISRPAAAQARTLFVNTWGGVWTTAQEAAFFKPFTEMTGIRIRTVAPVSAAKLRAQVQSRNYEWDVTGINEPEWLRADNEGYAEPIDYSIVNKDKLPPNAVFANGIANCVLSTNLCYRKDKFPNGGPQNWADFWDVKKFPGNRAMYHSAARSMAFALVADGVPLDKVYPMDVDRALRKLDEIKPHIKVWWKEGTQSQQLIRDGEVDMLPLWNARSSDLIAQGVPVEIVWHGGVAYRTMWGVVKGAPNKDIAWRFLEFTAQARPQAEFSRRVFYGPINPDALQYLPEELVRQMPSYEPNARQLVKTDAAWEAANLATMQERFLEWLAK
ncbi:MAG: ABC transporter substrate-binding protein [Alphaproteobacteria bacterium]|nr:ABC transporter substrate-binding protein [Alphaproteobacteria bacterium]